MPSASPFRLEELIRIKCYKKKHGKSRSPFPCFLILAAIARIPQQYKSFLVSAQIKDQVLYIRFNDWIDCYFDLIDCGYVIVLFRLIQSQSYFWLSSAIACEIYADIPGIFFFKHLL